MSYETSLHELRSKILNGALDVRDSKPVLLQLIRNQHIHALQLTSVVEELQKSTEHFFEEHEVTTYGDVNPYRINWNSKEFDKEAKICERNFSYERVIHLIKIKEHLQKLNIKGHTLNCSSPKQHAHNKEHGQRMTTTNQSIQIDDYLQQQVATGNLSSIRNTLISFLCDNSTSWDELTATAQWTEKNVVDLFTGYIEANYAKAINSDKSCWDSEYYYAQEVYLTANFSRKRWEHLVSVRKHLSEQNTPAFVRKQSTGTQKPLSAPKKNQQKAQNENSQNSFSGDNATKRQGANSFSMNIKIIVMVMAMLIALATFVLQGTSMQNNNAPISENKKTN